MASKSHQVSPESAASNALAHYPSAISLSSQILSSAVDLPPNPEIAYSIFKPAETASNPLDTLELARRAILKRRDVSIIDSVLPTVFVDKDALRIYAFAIDSQTDTNASSSRGALNSLILNGLSRIKSGSFSPLDISPCSPACASQETPCVNCRDPSFPPTSPRYETSPPAPSSRHLPRVSLRLVYAQFLRAVRERLIDDICSAERDVDPANHKDAKKERRRMKRMCRLKDGFVIFPPTAGAFVSEAMDWGMGWDHYAHNRPLIHCTLHLQLTLTRILIHPLFRPTTFLPLYSCPSRPYAHASAVPPPLCPGTPIILLPYGTPAYYLTQYSGPTAALTALFSASLAGLGCSSLLPASTNRTNTSCPSESASSSTPGTGGPTYAIAWLSVQNRQGEQKGITLIWPSSLALRFIPGSPAPHARTKLETIPELPMQLMPSPPLPHATVSIHSVPGLNMGDSVVGGEPTESAQSAPTSPAAAGPEVNPNAGVGVMPPVEEPIHSSPTEPRSSDPLLPPALTRRTRVSPTSATMRVFRTLSLGGVGGLESATAGSRDVRVVAREAEAYVDMVVKERDRERERLRREREAGASGRGAGSSPAAGPSNQTSVGAAGVEQQSQSQTQPQQVISGYPSPSPSSGSMPPPQAPPIPITHPPIAGPMPAQPPMNIGSASMPANTTGISAFPASATQNLASTAASTSPVVSFAGADAGASNADDSDLFGDFDAWSQDPNSWLGPSNDFMLDGSDNANFGSGNVAEPRIAMDVDMNIGVVEPITSAGGAGASSAWAGNVAKMDVDTGMDDIFTDADFDFWDTKPAAGVSAPTRTAAPAATLALPASASALDMKMTTDGIQFSGPGPPSMQPMPVQPTPWVPSILTEGLPPDVMQGLGVDGFSSAIEPSESDLFPPSPAETPDAGPEQGATRAISSLSISSRTSSNTWKDISGLKVVAQLDAPVAKSVFDPLPFSSVHRIADGKYTAGKFALPSPPDEEDRTRPIPLLRALSQSAPACPSEKMDGWRLKYDEATDPRVGVVRKLIGVKRKSFDQGSRDWRSTPSPSWVRASEEWETDVMHSQENEQADDGKSDAESEEDEDPWIEEDVPSPPGGTRPTTPAPSYLPPGPTLLHTHFQHAHLLPLSTALKPPETAHSPSNAGSVLAPVSVPTPVSPAAIGSSSEKSKSLEAAAHILAREVVESCVWGDAWRANLPEYLAECRLGTDVWQADVKQVARAIEALPSLAGPFELAEIFGQRRGAIRQDPVLEKLEMPMISVGKSDSIIQVLPTAVRFWEKLGLVPRGGKKDVIAFVLFEDLNEDRQILVERWLKFVSAVYTANNLGTHTPGQSTSCSRDGLVPLKFDSFRKTFAAFVADLPARKESYVFYIATPSSVISLSSTILRQVFSAVKRAQKTYAEAQILFQFLPAHLVYSAQYPPTNGCGQLLYMSCVYDRILRPVDRTMSRPFFEHGQRIRDFFQEPAFTLARPAQTKVNLVKDAPVKTLDVVDRHTFLHVGYRISACGKWIFAACIDQRGEAHDFGVWLTQSDSLETHLVQQLWTFTVNFAKRASVEWRIALVKLGSMTTTELDAWVNHLDKAIPECSELPAVHVSLYSADPNASWMFVAPSTTDKHPTSPNRAAKTPAGSFVADVSSSTYCLFYPPQTMLAQPAHDMDHLGTMLSHIPDTTDSTPDSHYSLPMKPLRTTTLIRVPSSSDYTSISMLHIHHFHSFKSPHSTLTIKDEDTHKELTRNYHELTVLAQLRFLKANPILPYHLGALEIMDTALSGSFASES